MGADIHTVDPPIRLGFKIQGETPVQELLEKNVRLSESVGVRAFKNSSQRKAVGVLSLIYYDPQTKIRRVPRFVVP